MERKQRQRRIWGDKGRGNGGEGDIEILISKFPNILISLLTIGFLFGFRHAFDADHIAAIAAVNSTTKNLRTALKQGVFWGIGHTLVLFLVGLSIFIFGIRLPADFSIWAEKTVAIILIFYGLRIFQRFFYSRKTYNGAVIHDHPPLGLHLHKNSSFRPSRSEAKQLTRRHHVSATFWIGALHGLAGSAALLILIISTFQSAFLGLLYILIFGLGSITGMFLFSLGIGALQMRYEKYTGFAAGIFSCLTALFLLFS